MRETKEVIFAFILGISTNAMYDVIIWIINHVKIIII